MKNDCIFCKIIKGDLPCYKLYEDEDFLVILDRFPKSLGDTLILTKKHYADLFELDEAVGAKLMALAKQIAGRLYETLRFDGMNLLQNNGEASGQQINHFHLHLLPRYDGDSMIIQGRTIDPSPEEFEGFVQRYLEGSGETK